MSLLTPGRVVCDRYEIQEELMRCRFSTMYMCVDRTDQSLAVLRRLDITPPETAEEAEKMRIRFLRDSNHLRHLQHPHLPRTLEMAEEKGEFFFILETFEGLSLQYVVKNIGGLPDQDLLQRWMLQLASALEYLHDQSPPVRNNDLRPAAILVDTVNRVKLTEVGTTRLLTQEDMSRLVADNAGVLPYTAPELLDAREGDEVADLYSLGATFYHLATGQSPPSPRERQRNSAPLPSMRTINSGLNAAFDELVQKLMSPFPKDRPANAAAVCEALKRIGGARGGGSLVMRPLQRDAMEGKAEADAQAPAPEGAPSVAVHAPRRSFFSFLPWRKEGAAEMPADAATVPMEDLANHPFVDISFLELDREVGRIIPEAISRRIHGVVIGRPSPAEISVAVKDPRQVYIFDHIFHATGGKYKPTLVRTSPILVELAQEFFYKVPSRLHHVTWLEWLEKKKFESHDLSILHVDERALSSTEDIRGPAIEAVDRLIKEAISVRASDIHVETYEDEVILKYRIDGVLYEMDTWPRKEAAAFVKRIKLMANMDIAQDRVPQGGRISVRVSDKEFDLRVSSVPVPDGESLVMRLLSKGAFSMTLDRLGFSPRNLEAYKRLVTQPYGLLPVSGPTGSGKSTTLYATLAQINDGRRKILTVEDPIEYKMKGVVQVQVNLAPREDEKRVTFARALREFLRQDPDVILVGEIRDDETAAICVQAALTGHLVLSTIHTNNAVGIVTRLRERNIEPFLVASTLIGGVAQRLVRLICEGCKEEVPVPEPLQRMFAGFPNPRMFRGAGCLTCHRSGYRGRVAIYEVLEVEPELREMMARNANPDEMTYAAQRKGMKTLFEDGLEKVVSGQVTIEEVQRVCMVV